MRERGQNRDLHDVADSDDRVPPLATFAFWSGRHEFGLLGINLFKRDGSGPAKGSHYSEKRSLGLWLVD